MPNSELYQFMYNFGFSAPGANSVYPVQPPAGNNVTLSDLQDGNANGQTAVGDTLEWDLGSGGTVTLHGFHNGGEPIVFDGTNYWGMSQSNTLFGSFGINFSGSGTYLYCFAAGTEIATPGGETQVEDLAIGDDIKTADGRIVPVKWIGRQTVRKMFAGEKAQLVRIRAGALGGGQPYRDLTVTADHGIVLEGYVINASALINEQAIDWVPMDEMDSTYVVYHVETENHDVILANGAASETYVDAAARSHFDNFQEYLDAYGTERIIPEMPLPRISSRRLLPAHLAMRLDAQPQGRSRRA